MEEFFINIFTSTRDLLPLLQSTTVEIFSLTRSTFSAAHGIASLQLSLFMEQYKFCRHN
jgi:hypothetical protein